MKRLGRRELAELREFSPLSPEFFGRDTRTVAIDLLGKILLVRDRETGRLCGGRIVETEAYAGTDAASHSARGKTPRSAPMFEEPGRAYVYFTYGMYDMLNVVTEPDGQAGAVLIRGLEPVLGKDLMEMRRLRVPEKNWTNGPARLCRALKITLQDNRESLLGPRLFLGEIPKPGSGEGAGTVYCSPRVGISKAVELEWRFYIAGNPHVSPVRENARGRAI